MATFVLQSLPPFHLQPLLSIDGTFSNRTNLTAQRMYVRNISDDDLKSASVTLTLARDNNLYLLPRFKYVFLVCML